MAYEVQIVSEYANQSGQDDSKKVVGSGGDWHEPVADVEPRPHRLSLRCANHSPYVDSSLLLVNVLVILDKLQNSNVRAEA